MFYYNNTALTIATHDIITAIDNVTAATDDIMYIVCHTITFSCYGIMTSHFKMVAKTEDFCVTSNKYCGTVFDLPKSQKIGSVLTD